MRPKVKCHLTRLSARFGGGLSADRFSGDFSGDIGKHHHASARSWRSRYSSPSVSSGGTSAAISRRVMLKPLKDPLAEGDTRAFGADPPPSGRYAGDSPAGARSHNLFLVGRGHHRVHSLAAATKRGRSARFRRDAGGHSRASPYQSPFWSSPAGEGAEDLLQMPFSPRHALPNRLRSPLPQHQQRRLTPATRLHFSRGVDHLIYQTGGTPEVTSASSRSRSTPE